MAMRWGDAALELARASLTAARRARDVVRHHEVCLAEGTLGRPTRAAAPVRFLGRVSVRDELDAILGATTWTQQERGGLPLWLRNARGHLSAPRTEDVAVLDALELPLPAPAGAWAWRPQVRAVLTLAPSVQEQLDRIRSKGVRQSLEHASAGTWVPSVRDRDEDLDRFYDSMFLPLIAERHGEHANVIARDELRRRWRRGGVLLFLEEAGRPVAGFLAYTSRSEPGTLFYWRNGMVADAAGDRERRAKLFAALERTVITHAISRGFQRLDMGLAPAVFDDRLFQHKRMVGCDFRRAEAAPRVLLAPRPGALRSVAAALPLLLEHGRDRFEALLAVDGDGSPASLRPVRTLVRDVCFPSLAHVTLYPSARLAAAGTLGPALDELSREVGVPLHVAPAPG
jgi:hypothetical protein